MKKQDCILGGFFCDGCGGCPQLQRCAVCQLRFEVGAMEDLGGGLICGECAHVQRVLREKKWRPAMTNEQLKRYIAGRDWAWNAAERKVVRSERERRRDDMQRNLERLKKQQEKYIKVEGIPCGLCGQKISLGDFAAHVQECLKRADEESAGWVGEAEEYKGYL